MEAIAREGRHDHLIIESTGISDPTPVAEAFEAAAAEAAANTTVEAKATTLVSVDTSDGNTNIGNDERGDCDTPSYFWRATKLQSRNPGIRNVIFRLLLFFASNCDFSKFSRPVVRCRTSRIQGYK